jgi:hypothetical protein
MDNKSLNNRASGLAAVLFVFFYLLAVIIVHEIINTENFKNKLPHINTYVVGSRWVFDEQR